MSLTRRWMANWDPERVAIRTGDSAITYAQLESRVGRAAGWLRARGLRRGQVLALQMGKEPAFLELHLAALALGVVTLPLNPAYPPAEVGWMLRDADAALAICPDPGGAPCPHEVPDGLAELLAATPQIPLPEGVDLGEIGVLCYTSGTTGRPKGAQIRQGNIAACVESLHRAWAWSKRDVLLHALPLFHVHGLFVAQHGALRAGATAIWLPRFEPEAVYAHLQADTTVFMGVPTFYHRLLEAQPEQRDLRGVRLFTSGSAGLPETDWEAWRARTGHRIVERYGMTEIGIVISNPLDDPRPGNIGVPLPGVQARVVRPDRTPCDPGEVGELEVGGPSVFAGYLNRPEATAEAVVGGWMRTGDLASVGEDGRIRLAGRRSELILRGGLNVYPAEVEGALLERSEVREAAVFGLPDPDLGERVHAAVVWAGTHPPDQSALETALRERLARYKIPEAWHFVDDLPRNAMGKVVKGTLRERFSTR